MKIKKKKMFKSKPLVFAHFSTKTGDFFGIDGKIPMFCHKYFLKSKMWFFFGDFGQKTRTAGLIMLKLSTKVNQVFWGKNLENENFMAAAIHCENWYFKKNKYFPLFSQQESQIFSNIFIWNNSRPRKWEQRSSFCQILKFQFP